MSLTFRTLRGARIAQVEDDFAQLRIAVFRAWPYLYDGDLEYERAYLARFAGQSGAVLVGAFDGGRLVGGATASPMEDHAADFAQAFAGTGRALDRMFYCAESVLLPAYRGRGAGHVFFDEREAAACAQGRDYVAFCSVIRPDDHPARPADYRPLDGFWRGRGYAPLPDVVARFSWKDMGEAAETEKPLQFWGRAL